MSSALFPDPRPGLRTWREWLTIQEPHRAATGLPAGLLTHCVTSGRSLPSLPHCQFLSPLWFQTVIKHVWHQKVFALKEAAFEPGFEEPGVSVAGNEGTVFQAERTEFGNTDSIPGKSTGSGM